MHDYKVMLCGAGCVAENGERWFVFQVFQDVLPVGFLLLLGYWDFRLLICDRFAQKWCSLLVTTLLKNVCGRSFKVCLQFWGCVDILGKSYTF